MMRQFVSHLTLADGLMAAILLRCVYMGAVKGAVYELFKTVGTFVAVIVALHYCTHLGAFLHEFILVPSRLQVMAAILVTWLVIFTVFQMAAVGWLALRQREGLSVFSQVGGVVLGFVRGLLVCSLTMTVILASGQRFLIVNAARSLSGAYLLEAAPRMYKKTFEWAIQPFFPSEELNKVVFKLKDKKIRRQ